MAEFLKLKKSNCKNCYKCIRHCPVKSIRFSGNQAHIVGDECILCGQCFVVCPQNAKEITDSTEQVRVLIQSGAPVIASLAPSFIANYGVGIDGMREALKKLGFADAEETARGASMVKTEYERLLSCEHRELLISSCCHSVNLLIQKYFPSLLYCLADVISPMQAHCQDIKMRFPDAKTVFIGPCVAKKDEAARSEGYTDAVLTFEELSRWLADERIVPEDSGERDENTKSRLFPVSGGIIASMTKKPEGYTYISVDGTDNCIAALKDIEEGGLKGCFIEMSACAGSCIGGPVMEKYRRTPLHDYAAVTSYAGKNDYNVERPDNIRKTFDYLDRHQKKYSEAEITETLRRMGKNKPEDELNCGSCGYDTCREKAAAILAGKAEVSMCLPFLKEKAESFSDNIINNTPNAIIVLNGNLEVQQINRAALKLLNLKRVSDVQGEQVIRILDPGPFLDVLHSGARIKDAPVYLAEYDRYVEQTITFDREYNVLICILRDVTAEENERAKKEEISRQTVDIADRVVDKQMRIVQEIASLLGETAAETKIALTKLKESISDE